MACNQRIPIKLRRYNRIKYGELLGNIMGTNLIGALNFCRDYNGSEKAAWAFTSEGHSPPIARCYAWHLNSGTGKLKGGDAYVCIK